MLRCIYTISIFLSIITSHYFPYLFTNSVPLPLSHFSRYLPEVGHWVRSFNSSGGPRVDNDPG